MIKLLTQIFGACALAALVSLSLGKFSYASENPNWELHTSAPGTIIELYQTIYEGEEGAAPVEDLVQAFPQGHGAFYWYDKMSDTCNLYFTLLEGQTDANFRAQEVSPGQWAAMEYLVGACRADASQHKDM